MKILNDLYDSVTGGGKLETAADIQVALQEEGYDICANTINDGLMVNGAHWDLEVEVRILTFLYDKGVKSRQRAMQVMQNIGYANPMHPVGDVLKTLRWDGVDRISELSTYFEDRHENIVYEDGTERTVFHAAMRRWMIAAAGRAMTQESKESTIQNYVLTLGGKAGIGKSTFVYWLASPFREYYSEVKFAPDDKLIERNLASFFIWEMAELASVTKNADVNSVKHRLTQNTLRYRKPYAKHDTVKKPLSNFIATANLDGSPLLFDQTGNRRFFILELESIDHGYETIDIMQLWAQAAQLYQSGESTSLIEEEVAVRDALNARHTEQLVIGESIPEYFEIDKYKTVWRTNPALVGEILDFVHKCGQDKARKEAASYLQAQEITKVGKPLQYMGLRISHNVWESGIDFPERIVMAINENLENNM